MDIPQKVNEMNELIKILWKILMRKSDQMALPNSRLLLLVVFILYFFTNSISGLTVSVSSAIFIRSFTIDALLLIVFLRLLTQFFKTQDDFIRSLIALFGTGALFNLIASPLIIKFSSLLEQEDLIESGDLPIWLPLLFFAIAIWSIMVMGHILSRSMTSTKESISKPPISGVAVALLYMMINFLVHSSILGD